MLSHGKINLWIKANIREITLEEFTEKTGENFREFDQNYWNDIQPFWEQYLRDKKKPKTNTPAYLLDNTSFDPLSLLITQNTQLRAAAKYGAMEERKRIAEELQEFVNKLNV